MSTARSRLAALRRHLADAERAAKAEADERAAAEEELAAARRSLAHLSAESAIGEIELGIDQKYALRKEKLNKDDSVLLQGLDLQEDGKPIAEQVVLRFACMLLLYWVWPF